MKVFAIMQSKSYENDYSVLAIFSTYEIAMQSKRLLMKFNNLRTNYVVEEFELDPDNEWLKAAGVKQ